MLSAAPATARQTTATPQAVREARASVTATPQAAMATTTIRPRRRTWLSQPVVNAATVAPAETDA